MSILSMSFLGSTAPFAWALISAEASLPFLAAFYGVYMSILRGELLSMLSENLSIFLL